MFTEVLFKAVLTELPIYWPSPRVLSARSSQSPSSFPGPILVQGPRTRTLPGCGEHKRTNLFPLTSKSTWQRINLRPEHFIRSFRIAQIGIRNTLIRATVNATYVRTSTEKNIFLFFYSVTRL